MTRRPRNARGEAGESEKSIAKSMTLKWLACGVLLFAFAVALGQKAGLRAPDWVISTVMTVGIVMNLIGLLTWWRSRSSQP